MITKNLHYTLKKKHYLIWSYKLWNIKHNNIQNNLTLYNQKYHYQNNLIQSNYKKLTVLIKALHKLTYNIVLMSNWFIYNQIKKLNKKKTIAIYINQKKQFKTNWQYNQIKITKYQIPTLLFTQTELHKTLLQNILNDKIPMITNSLNNYSDFSLLLKQNTIITKIFSLQWLIKQLQIKWLNI